MKKSHYTIPNYHKELFGDSKLRTKEELLEKMFGVSYTDFLENWSRLDHELTKETERFFYMVKVSDLRNYCCHEGWQYTYPNNKHVKLIEDIKKNGIKVPLLVVEYKGGYFVVEGHHRAGAANMLGIEKVKCLVLRKEI